MHPQAPAAGALSIRSAVAHVAALYLIAAGPATWLSLADVTGLTASSGIWETSGRWLGYGCQVAGVLWLVALVAGRARTTANRIGLLALATLALTPGLLLITSTTTNLSAADTAHTLATTLVLLELVHEVGRRHGLLSHDTEARIPRRSAATYRRAQLAWTVTASLALIAASAQLMMHILQMEHGPLQAPAPQWYGLEVWTYETSLYLWTSVTEEVVLTAAVVVLLSAARCPARHIILICAAMRVIPHLYLGTAAIATALLGAGAAYLVLSARNRVLAAVALTGVHLAWDAVLTDLITAAGITTSGQRWALTAVMAAAALVAHLYYQVAAPHPRRVEARHAQQRAQGAGSGRPGGMR